jgi:chitodextrinase
MTFDYAPPSGTVAQVVASPDRLTLSPGGSATVTLAVTSLPGATAGTYNLTAAGAQGAGAFLPTAGGAGGTSVSGLTLQLTAPAGTALSAPSGVSAAALGAGAVTLSWTPPSGAVSGYRVLRGSALFSTGATTLVDAAVQPGTTYTYSVQAVDQLGNLSPASTVTVTTPAATDSTPPAAPVVSAQATDHTLTVSWTSTSPDVAYFRVYPCLVPRCVLPGSARSFVLAGLPTQTEYDIQVVAVDGDGNMSPIQISLPVFTAAAGDVPPTRPTQLASSGSYGSLALSWQPSTGGSGIGYRVYRDNRQVAVVTTPSYTDTTSTSPSEYYVQAFDEAGSLSQPSPRVWLPGSGSPAPAAVATGPSPVITAPLPPSVPAGAVTVSVSAPGASSVTFSVDGATVATSPSAPFGFTWTAAPGTHTVSAVARDAAGGTGSASVTLVAVGTASTTTTAAATTTTATPPSTPGGLKALATGTAQVALGWGPVSGGTAYEVYRDGTKIGESTTPVFLDGGLAAGSTHTYQVLARDASGNRSALSSKLSVKLAALAKGTTATVAGLVVGSSGVAVSGAAVKVGAKTAKTNAAGVWSSPVTPGTSTLTVSATGYTTSSSTVSAVAGQTVVVVTQLTR